MTKFDKADAYTWHGVWDEGAQGWQEFFGDPPEFGGLPPRDLTPDDTAAFNDDQWKSLASPAGQRLYTPKNKKGGKDGADGNAGAGPA